MLISGPAGAVRALTFHLLGEERTLDDADGEAIVQHYATQFASLPASVPRRDAITRFVGFQRRIDDRRTAHFLGIEVPDACDPGAGRSCWTLGPDTRRLRSQAGTAAQPIRWLWRSEPRVDNARTIGEFATEDGQPTWISANSYFRPDGVGAADDGVQLVEPDPSWPARYAEFADELRGVLGPSLALRIEHYGSTAIPGIPAKPIIDILVGVPSFEAAKAEAMPVFNTLEWDYWWHDAHMLFVHRDGLMGARIHHVHLAPRGHRLWEGLAFRDHLRAHPDAARAYAALKRELAAAHGRDRERYTMAKTDFVARILAQSR